MNDKELETSLLQLKKQLTMPDKLEEELLQTSQKSRQSRHENEKKHCPSHPHGRYRRLCTAAAAALFCLCAVGSTSLAYNAYQEKQLAVFMDAELTQTEIENLGSEISKIADVSSYRYISGDEAWAEFKAAYFSGDPESERLADSFTENPLADSFNYEVSVRFGADTQAVRNQIGRLPGVRKITTVREAKQEAMEH